MSEGTADWYRRAARELAATSARQVEWCLGVADDPRMLELLDALPRPARQPSLLFAVAAFLGAPDAPYDAWAAWVLAHADAIVAELPVRRVQTNEPMRCVPLIAGLARIAGPLALIELGASAGLCLIPERYRYRLRTPAGLRTLGEGAPSLDAELDDAALAPDGLPDIRWRRGIDLHPVDLTRTEGRRWLTASLPPDRPERGERLTAAIAAALDDPPEVVAGDALESLAEVGAHAPGGVTRVVASLGTAVYLSPADRARLLAEIASTGCHALTFEARGAIPEIAERWEALVGEGRAEPAATFVLALDGEPLASGSPHGDRLVAVRPAGRHGGRASDS